jgi:hypothetical protein
MGNGWPIVNGPRLWLKGSILLVSWTLPVLILIVARSNKISISYPDIASLRPDLTQHKNQIGAFNYLIWDSNANYRPVFSVHFDNLSAENNKLGVFNTALHKVVKIQDLELKLYRYNSGKATATSKPDISTVSDCINNDLESITTDANTIVERIIHRLTDPAYGWRANIDIGNVSEVRVNNLDYQVFHDGELFFATQSRRAIVSYGQSDVLLHGRAKITIADGSTLESNYIKWDVKKQHFSVKGAYVLNRGGTITTGKDICFDAQLKSVEGQYTKSKGKEQKCIAKL